MLKRTHTCGELTGEQSGQTAILNGWVDTRRDHGGLVFIDLRDRYGLTQVVFDPKAGDALMAAAHDLRSEFVIGVKGVISPRLPGKENPKLKTGAIELQATEIEVFSKTETPPFEINGGSEPNEELRLTHRYLDLRRPEMQRIMLARHKMLQVMRRTMSDMDFVEVETPILGRSTPEGARDFLVPSRMNAGHFYALPQSPQLYKQILMVAGYDRYFQIARCFRDEDLRANRQPEFTQLDVEMSFVEFEDVIGTMEHVVAALAKELTGETLSLPLLRVEYHDAVERYGVDRPDYRFGMQLKDLADLDDPDDLDELRRFSVFAQALDNGGRVRGICVPGGGKHYTRRALDELTESIKTYGAKGLVWLKVEDGDKPFTGPTAKFFGVGIQAIMLQKFEAKPGDLILIVADSQQVTSQSLSALRIRLGAELKLYDPKSFHYSWIVKFPLLARDEEENRYVAEHHPFTMPLPEDLHLLDSDPAKVRAQAYDLVVNGEECGGGTIRIHDSAIQSKVFSLLGLSAEEAEEKFGFLLNALKFGAPPHGGIALGVDRMVMLYTGLTNIRDCIAFPKTAKGTDLMTGAPGTVDSRQLRDLRIRMVEPA